MKGYFFKLFGLFLWAVVFVSITGCTFGRKDVVSVPTPVACVKVADIPIEPAEVGGMLTSNAKQDSALLAVLALDLRDYGKKLRALLRGCE